MYSKLRLERRPVELDVAREGGAKVQANKHWRVAAQNTHTHTHRRPVEQRGVEKRAKAGDTTK